MDDFKEIILDEIARLHVKLHIHDSYKDTSEDLLHMIEDRARLEQLKEVVRWNPKWDNLALGGEVAKKIREIAEI